MFYYGNFFLSIGNRIRDKLDTLHSVPEWKKVLMMTIPFSLKKKLCLKLQLVIHVRCQNKTAILSIHWEEGSKNRRMSLSSFGNNKFPNTEKMVGNTCNLESKFEQWSLESCIRRCTVKKTHYRTPTEHQNKVPPSGGNNLYGPNISNSAVNEFHVPIERCMFL